MTRTVGNAVLRTTSRRGPRPSSAHPISLELTGLEMTDVEVVETEARTRAAVALLVDISFSMVMEGRRSPW